MSTSDPPDGPASPDPRELLTERLRLPERRVLMVDDEPDILESMKMYLEGCLTGVTVETLASGEAALERLEACDYDLIMSDFRMGEVDGKAVLAHAQRLQPETPRIMVTAYPDLDLALDALNEGGVQRFLTKPVEPMKLVELVYDLLQEQRREQERQVAYKRALELLRADPQQPPKGVVGP